MMEHDGCAESSRYVKIEHDSMILRQTSSHIVSPGTPEDLAMEHKFHGIGGKSDEICWLIMESGS